MFKKFLVLFCLIAVFLIILPVSAQYGLQTTGGEAGYETAGPKTDVYSVVGTVISTALSMVAVLFLGIMIYSGARWMTARGNEDMVKKAKDTIIQSVIGLVVTISAYAVSNFIIGRLVG